MKSLFFKFNEVFDKSTNLYIRFIISLLVVLTPFLLFSLIVFIAINNYLRAVVLVLFLLVSFFERTRDNKLVLGFIGLIPLGFYVATSPVFIGYMLGVQALNIGGILWDNKLITVFTGLSIFGIIKTLKGASSVYEWFMNSGIGGYFFPEYKNIKQDLALKNQTITNLIAENNILVTSLRTVKDSLRQLQITAIDTFNRMEEKLYKKQEQNLMLNQPQREENLDVAIQEQKSITQLQQQLGKVISESDTVIDNAETVLTQNQQNTQQIIAIQQQSTAIVSDSTLTAVQKVLTGGALIFGGDTLRYFMSGSESVYLIKGYNLFKEYMRPSYALVTTAVGSGIAVFGVGETVNSAIYITTTVVKGTQNLIEKGVKNITENMKVIPNTRQSQDFVKIDVLKATTPEAMKLQLLEALKDAEKTKIPNTTIDPAKSLNTSPPSRPKGPTQILTATSPKLPSLPSESSIGGVQDIPLTRKPNYGDFITPPPLTSTDLKLPKLPKKDKIWLK